MLNRYTGHTVAEHIFIWAVGPECNVNMFNCALDVLLLTYFLTYT